MNVSFGPGSQAVPPAPQQEAKAPASQVPALRNNGPRVLGDYLPGLNDVIYSRINIVHPLGELKEMFPVGAIVLNKETILFTPQVVDKKTSAVITPALPPVNITIIGVKSMRFTEVTVGGAQGLLVNTEEQVLAAGGTLDYNEWELKKASGMKRFAPLIDFVVLIERPASCADDDSVFVFSIDGKKYAMGILGLAKSAYTSAAKPILTARKQGYLMNGYYTRSIQLTSILKPFKGGKEAWVPVVVAGLKSTPAMQEFIVNYFGEVTPQTTTSAPVEATPASAPVTSAPNEATSAPQAQTVGAAISTPAGVGAAVATVAVPSAEIADSVAADIV